MKRGKEVRNTTQTTIVHTSGGLLSGIKEGMGCCVGIIIVFFVLFLLIAISSSK